MSLGKARQDWREKLGAAVRPGVEATLLAAVALGCAQTGWSVLAPGSAGASSGNSGPNVRLMNAANADARTPFAPGVSADGAAARAAVALAESLKLDGVRMAEDPARSGAFFTMADGAQRAFAVGQEIAPGVTLDDVRAQYVVISYTGGAREIPLQRVSSYSFARALMGARADAADAAAIEAPPTVQQAAATPVAPERAVPADLAATPFSVSSQNGEDVESASVANNTQAARSFAASLASSQPAPENTGAAAAANGASANPASGQSLFAARVVEEAQNDAQNFAQNDRAAHAPAAFASNAFTQDAGAIMAMIARSEVNDGAVRGWRVTALPPSAQAAGLHEGDLVLSVNGVGPGDAAALLNAVSSGQVALRVRRAGGEEVMLSLTVSPPT